MSKFYTQSSFQSSFEQSFSQYLPSRPHCTNHFANGVYPKHKSIALLHRYIQPNSDKMIRFLCFDVDRKHSAFAWEDCNLPMPFAVVVNPNTTHTHLIYQLKNPVCCSDLAEIKPLKYLAAIQYAMTQKLNADQNYNGFLVQNPLHSDWNVLPIGINVSYSLDELADWVTLTKLPKAAKSSQVFALGRNCYLFDILRFWAYRNVKHYRSLGTEKWRLEVLSQAQQFNDFEQPLNPNEVKAIAKSVSNWVWKNIFHDNPEYIEKKSRQGKAGNIASIKTRASKAMNLKVSANLLREQGHSISEIARQLQVSRMTVYRWFDND